MTEKQAFLKVLSSLCVKETDFSEIMKNFIETEEALIKAARHIMSDSEIIERERRLHSAARLYFMTGGGL